MVEENSFIDISQDEHEKKYRKLGTELEEKKQRLIELKVKKSDLKLRNGVLQGVLVKHF